MSRHIIFVLAGLALLMGSIDSTIVAVAIPNLTLALDAPLTSVGWTLTAYLLVQIIMLPIAGKLSDTFGRRRVFLACLGIFTLGSLLCGLAPSIGALIAFRAVQAVGGGGLLPSAFGIVADQFRAQRAQAIGLFTSIGPLGAIIGPNLGGYVLEHWTWRDLFFINVPVGLVALVGVGLLVRDRQPASARLELDLVGLGMYSGAVVLLIAAMSLAGGDPSLWLSPLLWAVLALSALLAGLFVRHIRRTDQPIIDPGILLKAPFGTANLYAFLFGAATFGFFSFIPLYALSRYGLSTSESGAVLTPRALAMIATSTVASLLVARTGYRRPMLVGIGLVILTLLILSQGWTRLELGGVSLSGFWLMASIIMLGGIGIGLCGPAASNAALDLAPHKAASLTGIRSMANLTGGALSIAGIVLVLSYAPDAARGLELVFQALAGVLLLAVVLVFFIPDRARRAGRFVAQDVQPTLRPVRIVDRRAFPSRRLTAPASAGIVQHQAA